MGKNKFFKELEVVAIIFLLAIFFYSCSSTPSVNRNLAIVSQSEQDSIFQQLIQLTAGQVAYRKDSLSFLIIPLQNSCPPCLKKTLDSLEKHKNHLLDNQFVILSARGGTKTMSALFKKNKQQLPINVPQIVYDSMDLGNRLNIYRDNPAIYYTANRKAYKKVLANSSTIKEDLYQFFNLSTQSK